jgi:hypothetical protein
MHTIFWLENLKGRDHVKNLVILEWILGRWAGLVACGSGQVTVADTCEHGNELSGSIRSREFD